MLDSVITMTVEDILICVLVVVAIAALIMLIVMLKKFSDTANDLSETLEKVNTLLDDSEVLMGEASDILSTAKSTAEIACRSVLRASRTLDAASDIVRSNRSKISAVTGLVNATTSMLSLSDKKKAQRTQKPMPRKK